MKVSAKELLNIISKQVRLKYKDGMRFRDNEYTLHDYATWGEFIRENKVDQGKYIPELHDCEDFAAEFRGDSKKELLNAGEIVVQRKGIDTGNNTHMVNIIITDDRVVHILEPQTDKFYPNKIITIIEGEV